MSNRVEQLQFVAIGPYRGELGWRFDERMPAEALRTIDAFANDDFRDYFMSPRRTVRVGPFEIATTCAPWDQLCDWDEDEIEAIEGLHTLPEFCSRLDAKLASDRLRLPTEDEFEAACGPDLFPWGDELPQGIPNDGQTEFTKHTQPTKNGLLLDPSTYHCEVVREALKLGDGGESVCGAYPWPIPWLSFCPAYRVDRWSLDDFMYHALDQVYVRPVRL